MEQSPTRRVKEAFVVADTRKAGPFHSPEALLASIEKLQQEAASWTDNQIDAFIAQDNPNRLRDYDDAQWKLDRVDLEKCTVWSHMGRRD